MRAWKIIEPGVIRCEDAESQLVGENCVKIKILESAVSLRDEYVFNGRIKSNFPIIPAGTCIGIVSETGENVKKLVRGNKVLAVPKISCHECGVCLSGKTYDCQKTSTFGINADGFLRDFAVVNANDLYLLPDRIACSDALYVDYINIAISAILRLNLDKGAHIVVVGATDMGIILAQAAIYYQMVPILIDIDQGRLNIAESLGVYYTVNSMLSAPYKKILTITGGKMADGLVYAASSDMPLQQCFDYIKKSGICVIAGDGNTEKNLNGDFSVLVSKGLTLSGISGEMRNVASAINILANKSVNVNPLIGKSIPFEDAGKIFESGAFEEIRDKKIIVKNA